MKKTVKSLALILAMALILISLVGCGADKADKLVATKETEDEDMGNYKEEIVVTFKDDKVDSVEMSMEFEDEDTAKSMYSLYQLGMSMSEDNEMEGMSVSQEGKKFIMTMDAKAYADEQGINDEELTKEAIKAALEEDGYTVK